MEKQTLPAIKILEVTKQNIEAAIKKYNDNPKNNLFLTIQDFRRMAYELLSQSILQGKEIPVKLKR